MNPLDDLHASEQDADDDGVAPIAELVAAVSWLRRGAMPGLTVWGAIEQALRPATGVDWDEPDPLRAALRVAAAEPCKSIENILGGAIRLWLAATSHTFNEGRPW